MKYLDNKEEALSQFGLFLYMRGDVDGAIVQLLAATETAGISKASMILVSLLLNRKLPDDIAEAIRRLESVLEQIDTQDPATRFDIAEQLTRLGDNAELANQRDKLLGNLPRIEQLLLGALQIQESNPTSAKEKLLEAKGLLSADSGEYQKFLVGNALRELNEYELALDVFELCKRMEHGAEGTEFVIKCAWKADDPHFIIKYCERLRERGNQTDYSVESQVIALQRVNAPDEALDVIDEHLNTDPNPRFSSVLRLYRSVIGKRLGRADLVENDPERLPAFDQVPVDAANVVAMLLFQGGLPARGILYAYRSLRRNFEDPSAHKCMWQLMLEHEKNPVLAAPERVTVDTAVTYIFDDEKTETKIIESEHPVIPTRGELCPRSSLGNRLLGKSVGDEFVLKETPMGDIKAKIISIDHKFRFRARDCLDGWDRRFPDDPFLYKFKMPLNDAGEFDAAAFILQLEELHKPRSAFDQLAASEPITPHLYSSTTSESIVDSILHLANLEDAPILCVDGTDADYAQCRDCIKGANLLVLDSSALTTIFLLGLDEYIRRLPVALAVCGGSVEEFRSILNNNYHSFWSKRSMNWRPDGAHFSERSDDEIDNGRERLASFLDVVENELEIIPGTIAGELERTRRKAIEKYGGHAVVQSIAAAKVRSAGLWTDDIGVALYAKEESLGRVWTEVMIGHLREEGILDAKACNRMLLQLVDAKYKYTRLSQEMIELAIAESDCLATQRPLSMCINWIGESGVQEEGAVRLSATYIKLLSASLHPKSQRLAILSDLVRSIGNRPDALRILDYFTRPWTEILDFESDLEIEFRRIAAVEKLRCVGTSSLILPPDIT